MVSLFNHLSLELEKTKTEPNFDPKIIDSVNENIKNILMLYKKEVFF
jgi:hypothetical protein